MADHNTLTHSFVSGVADGANTALVRPSNWNKEHVFSGGAAGNVLRWDPSQTDHVRWASAGVIDVTAPPYNVPNDGVTDAAPAIAAMLSAIGSVGARLYFPPGIYTTNSSGALLTLTANSIHIFGASRGATVLRNTGTGTVVALNTVSYCSVTDMTLDGNGTANSCLDVNASIGGQFERLVALNSHGNGLAFRGTSSSGNVIRACTISSNVATSTYTGCLSITDGTGYRVEHCRFIGSAGTYLTGLFLQGFGSTIDVVNIGSVYSGDFTTGANLINTAKYTEIGCQYAVTAATTILWYWQTDDPLTVIQPQVNVTGTLYSFIVTGGRDLTRLTLVAGAASGATRSPTMIPRLHTSAGAANAIMGLRGNLSTQATTIPIGNPANTTDYTAFSYTLPAATLGVEPLSGGVTGVEIEFGGNTASNANTKRASIWMAGTRIADTGNVAWSAVGWVLRVRVFRTSDTLVFYTSIIMANNIAIPVFHGAVSVPALSTNTTALLGTVASPVSGAVNDMVAFSFTVQYIG